MTSMPEPSLSNFRTSAISCWSTIPHPSASLPPLRTQAPGAEAAKKKAPLPPEPEQDFTVDALPDTAIYLTSLGGETTELLPTWEAPDAPWGSAWDEPLTLA